MRPWTKPRKGIAPRATAMTELGTIVRIGSLLVSYVVDVDIKIGAETHP